MDLVFITEHKKKRGGKGSSSHMRATFLNMQLCYHRIHEERWEGANKKKRRVVGTGKRTVVHECVCVDTNS